MSANRALQSAPALMQETDRHTDIPSESPYLLTAEAARFLKFDRRGNGTERPIASAMQLFRKWAARNRVPELRRGRTLLYDKRVLAACLRLKAPRVVRLQKGA